MGVVDFSVLGALQKVRSFVAGATPAEAADGRLPATPRSRSGGPSPENSPPPAATRSGGRRAIALRRQISSPELLRCRAVRRADDEDDDEPGVQFFTHGNDFLHDFSDTESVSVSTPNDINRSLTPSPLESPTWMVKQNDSSPISRKNGRFSPDSPGYGTKASLGSDGSPQQINGSVTDSGDGSKTQYPVEFGANIWCPPPPEDEGDDIESRLFGFQDEDDEAGDSSGLLVSGSFSANKIAAIDEVTNTAQEECLKTAVLGHFRALVAQLLKAEGIDMGKDDGSKGWLDIVSSLTWQAASYVRPDTKKGGSMDPTDYVKVKCIASGDPRDSNFVRGVVCSKNVKHKRMVSEHRNAKLLILGGALEYHRVPNKLASIGRILEQEKEHMKMIVGKIESRRPNVVLVEKTVSSSAQELFSKDISLVLNVKRTLLDRVSRCTGAQIASSADSIASVRLGQCEAFKVQKVTEFPSAKQTNRRSSKTLMFFEGCPWRLGCTVLLRGSCREELKRIKRAVQLAVFAAYHLSLETSFFADEGATLPKLPSRHVVVDPDTRNCTNSNSAALTNVGMPHGRKSEHDKLSQTAMVNIMFENTPVSPSSLPSNGEGHMFVGACQHKETEYSVDHKNSCEHCVSRATGSCNGYETSLCSSDNDSMTQNQNLQNSAKLTSNAHQYEFPAKECQQVDHWDRQPHDDQSVDQRDLNKFSGEYFPGSDNHQSILVSLSSTCIPKGLVCERSHLFRIKFYGSFDKPLGRYLRDDLFDEAYRCQSCKEPSESHIRRYTHQHGSLTISVRRLQSRKLPGERDGRIWMWHRCLKCKPKDGVPPATRRIIMSDAAWGLSLGKFLELSFSNHASANRVASCGHSLQRDCLRFYGYGNMVAFFRYSPVDILSVNLPPPVLDFNCCSTQEWLKRVAVEIFGKMESLHVEVSEFLHCTEKNIVTEDEPVRECVQRQIIEMKDWLKMQRNEYEMLLLPVMRESNHPMQTSIDILELNRLRRGLLLDAYIWDRRLCHIDSVLNTHGHISKTNPDNLDILLCTRLKEWKADLLCGDTEIEKSLGSPKKSLLSREGHLNDNEYSVADTNLEICLEGHPVDDADDLDKVYNKFSGVKKRPTAEPTDGLEPVERLPSLASIFSDTIDLAWTGSCDLQHDLPQAFTKIDENVSFNLDSPKYSNLVTPVRIHSFSSTLGLRQRERTGLVPASLHLSSFKSAEYFGAMRSILKDPMPNMRRSCSQRSPGTIEKLNVVLARKPTYISSTSNIINDGARLLLPQTGYEHDVVVAVYEDEPTSIISYAMTSEEYVEQVTHRLNSSLSFSHQPNTNGISSHGLEASSPSQGDHLHSKGTHFKLSFDDDSPISPDKTKFSVICYFAKHFAALRKKCCPKDIDYIRSLSRCKRWNAQGGKSNVYFAKTLDERFIIKQVTRTELESFVEFAPQYFKYLMESLASGSPTCLAKIVGLYQVGVKSLKTGKEVRMDLMVMENVFFERKISRVYDLKGSLRSRYTAGDSKVLLDANLIEALHTKPIFLGSKAKRRLERAVWNDTSFLALADVMDYSLLVGIDEEKKELVIGIIDYLRQYTWDKQLETWVKASGILGGPKNESPTVISPMQYKKRFRKAMSKYFLTVPDQWSS
ncbi:putative 1-phosphatidylinositol-3-phosphate 5-kinase FAB1C [Zea mays]|uniref:1-phosphatidylinositol-3-phosphate 5-kinase n=4 Tax=Zea mays TaxID=4577 RepID=A0A1D6KPF7_MAIZE|nr:putative 1-phosphatidylinositol-3-phosphate 5-kinase FAB1C [Zea mays]ONM04689.1 Putative 1-phosphatidylinositol-3-phosphate 5-kinase FAB1C [Zea mays]|eukprot:XP_008664671.1 putative 1-phosphatidylinositol-3-phosphate 5-kinase FAB1C [Zea mays]